MSSKTRRSERDSGSYPVIHELECKACGRCISACRASVLAMGTAFNERGYRYVVYAGASCTGCGSCYYTCPEPGAIEVHIPLRSDPGTEQQKGS